MQIKVVYFAICENITQSSFSYFEPQKNLVRKQQESINPKLIHVYTQLKKIVWNICAQTQHQINILS